MDAARRADQSPPPAPPRSSSGGATKACDYCGRPTTAGRLPPTHVRRARVDLAPRVCADCVTLEPDRPGSSLRAAARVLGCADEDDSLFHEAIRAELASLDGLLYADPADPLRSRRLAPQEEPWAHVPAATREALGRAWARRLELGNKTAARSPTRAASPPSGPRGCVLCGVGLSSSWERVVTSALTRGPALIDGHLCATCASVRASVGAIGQRLVERAAMEAHGLRWTEDARAPGLVAWIATGRGPGEPWEWVDLTPPCPPPRAEQLAADVRALTARVEALEARLP